MDTILQILEELFTRKKAKTLSKMVTTINKDVGWAAQSALCTNISLKSMKSANLFLSRVLVDGLTVERTISGQTVREAIFPNRAKSSAMIVKRLRFAFDVGASGDMSSLSASLPSAKHIVFKHLLQEAMGKLVHMITLTVGITEKGIVPSDSAFGRISHPAITYPSSLTILRLMTADMTHSNGSLARSVELPWMGAFAESWQRGMRTAFSQLTHLEILVRATDQELMDFQTLWGEEDGKLIGTHPFLHTGLMKGVTSTNIRYLSFWYGAERAGYNKTFNVEAYNDLDDGVAGYLLVEKDEHGQ